MKTEQELLQDVLDARLKVTEQEGFLSDAKQTKKQAEDELIRHMDETDIKSFKSATVNCTVSRKEGLSVKIVDGKKEDAYTWIEEDCGRGDMMKRSVHNKTLSSFIGQRIKDAEPVPAELFDHFFYPYLSIKM